MVIKINGVVMPSPTTYQWDKTDLDSNSSGRNAAGTMLRDRITSKIKLILEWKKLSMSDMSQILKAVSDTFFECTYPDAQSGTFITKTFYVGDRSSPLMRVEGENLYWESLKMNFTEK